MTAEEFTANVKSTGLKLRKVAEVCGKSEFTIYRYMNGSAKVPQLVAEKIIRLDEFINGKDK
jgi:predicted DNA-binding transcriptional regulator AlpA